VGAHGHPAKLCHPPRRHWCGLWPHVPCAPRTAWPCACSSGVSRNHTGERHPWVSTAGCHPRAGGAHCPHPCRLLGATTVPLRCLAEDPGLPLDLGQLPLRDPQGHPTGATISLRCSYVPPGQVAAGNATSQRSEGMAPSLSPPRPTPVQGTAIGMAPRRHPKPAAGKKEDFQVGHPRVR